jgi:hypothetical protein
MGSIKPRYRVGLIFLCFQLPCGRHPGAKTCTSLIIVKDCILLSSSVGWCIDGVTWLPTIRENYFVASFSYVWNNSFPQPCEVTNEIRWSHVSTQFCVFLWNSKLERNDEIYEQLCMVRSLMHMLHDMYETLYNSSECEEVTNGIFHFKWTKILKLVPKTPYNIWHKYLQIADITGCVNAIKFNLQKYSWFSKPQLYLK